MTASRCRCGLIWGMVFVVLGLPSAGASQKAAAKAGRVLKFETYQDKQKQHRWRLKATNGQVIATSGQGYKDKRDCENAIDVIKKGAEKAKVEEAAE